MPKRSQREGLWTRAMSNSHSPWWGFLPVVIRRMERSLVFIPSISSYLTQSLVYSRRRIEKVVGNERSTVHDGAHTAARREGESVGAGSRARRLREASVGIQSRSEAHESEAPIIGDISAGG
ncbi:unnamed protein product [Fusarium graminearum]|nr:unnamed protein product [Fusarium graminearum]CAG2001317.1 unnamed protein product [Fusarium graminearum]VTO93505.1 unnamed protein product [Fusarium graminearum]